MNKLNPKKFPLGTRRILFGSGKTHRMSGRLMVFREKHGNRYFEADTPEKTMAACLKILTERYGPDGDWGTAADNIKSIKEYMPTPPEIPKEEVDKLQYPNMKEELLDKWKKYEKEVRGREQEMKIWKLAERAIKDKDAYAALQIIWEWQGREYENVDFEWTENVEIDGLFDRMKFACHVCGKRRPDEKISVASADAPKIAGFRAINDIRYCNDKKKCAKVAREMAKRKNPWDHPSRSGADGA